MDRKRIYRTEGKDAVLFGVCGGIAEYLGVDEAVVRAITAGLVIVGGLSIWVYIIAAILFPKKSDIYPDY